MDNDLVSPRRRRMLGGAVALAGLSAVGCQNRRATIGIVNYVPVMAQITAGFKARMAELGHVEGRNVIYLDAGVLDPKTDAVEREIRSLRERGVDLMLTLGTRPAQFAKHVFAGTNVPIVFAPVINPVQEGLVESLAHPGGLVTGVQNGDTLPKCLEWLHAMVPKASRIHFVYHPRDRVSLTALQDLKVAAPAIGVELVALEAAGSSEAGALVAALPQGSALFLAPAPSLFPMEPMLNAAVGRGIAVGMNNAEYLMDLALMNFGAVYANIGWLAARMIDQILKGANPADLPVETPEYALTINLKMARRIGLEIPDSIVGQAQKVLR